MSHLYDPVIVGYDGSDQAEDALTLGRLLGTITRGGIVLAYITPSQPPFERQSRIYAQGRREKVHEVLEPALARLEQHPQVEPASIDSSSAARGLHELAAEYGVFGQPSLVIGSTHRGKVGRVVLGSVGEMLISGAPCALFVAPHGYASHAPAQMTRVVVGFDGTPESHAALASAHALARAGEAALRAVSVMTRDGSMLQARLDEALSGLDGPVEAAVVDGHPVDRLAEAAEDADVLVLGARGYGPLHHVLVGSVSSRLMRSAPSPVLVVPRPAPVEPAADQPEAAGKTGA